MPKTDPGRGCFCKGMKQSEYRVRSCFKGHVVSKPFKAQHRRSCGVLVCIHIHTHVKCILNLCACDSCGYVGMCVWVFACKLEQKVPPSVNNFLPSYSFSSLFLLLCNILRKMYCFTTKQIGYIKTHTDWTLADFSVVYDVETQVHSYG